MGALLGSQTREFSHDEEAMNLLVRPSNMWSGQLLYIAANLGLWWLMAPLTPASTMRLWEVVAIACLLSMAGLHVAYIVAEKRGIGAVKRWMQFERIVGLGDELLAVASMFMLLPHAGQPELIFATAFYIGYIPSGILSEPGNVLRLRRSVMTVLGSFALFLYIYEGQIGQLLALIVLGYGAFLLKGINSVHKIVANAVEAREAARATADELAIAVAEVSEERDAKTRFISTASHDLGQPLQAARLFSEQLSAAVSTPAATRTLSALGRAIVSAQKMLGNMLYHMQLEADAVTPHPQAIELKNFLGDLAEQYAPMASQAGMTIDVRGRPSVVFADMALLERLVGNLIQNAIVHSGGTSVSLCCFSAPDRHSIWVVDNGVGIAEGEQNAIFDDYKQGSNSQSPVRGGFGLGLASVSRLASLMRGTVRLDLRCKRGAAFCLALPVDKGARL